MVFEMILIKFFVCAFLFLPICNTATVEIHDQSPTLNKVVPHVATIVSPAPNVLSNTQHKFNLHPVPSTISLQGGSSTNYQPYPTLSNGYSYLPPPSHQTQHLNSNQPALNVLNNQFLHPQHQQSISSHSSTSKPEIHTQNSTQHNVHHHFITQSQTSSPQINPGHLFVNNPFLHNSPSVSVSKPPVIQVQGVSLTPSYVHNPFLNSQPSSTIAPPVASTKPIFVQLQGGNPSIPNYSQNPFLNSQLPSTIAPPVTSAKPIFVQLQGGNPSIPNYSQNPFLNSQLPSTIAPPVTSAKPIFVQLQGGNPSIPNYSQNPFLNSQPPSTIAPAITSVKPQENPLIPNYVHNSFLNQQKPSEVSPPITSLKPPVIHQQGVPSTPNYNNNPFLNQPSGTPVVPPNPPAAQKPIFTYVPYLPPSTVPQQPLLPATQPPALVHPLPSTEIKGINQLRSFCIKTRGQFSSGRCNTFINCWDDVAVEQPCPPGLLFNSAGFCDYVQNVDCHGRIYQEVSISETVAPAVNPYPQVISETVQPIPSVWHTTDKPGVAIITQQPSNFVTFLPETVRPSTSDLVVAPENVALKLRCLKPRGQFPSDVCHRYIDCWDGSAVEHDCPAGLYFSEKGYCDYLQNVNCNSRTVIKAALESSCPIPDGTFKDQGNCSRYYTCISNVIVAKNECPSGLYFNDVIGVCDYSFRVNCNREPFIYEPVKKEEVVQKIPASVLDTSVVCTPGKIFRLTNDCTSAVLCRKGVTEVVYCPTGLAYDAKSDRCLPAQLVQCVY